MASKQILKLYSYCQSSASFRVRIALNQKKIPHEMVTINLLKQEQKGDEYSKINPNKCVPSLVVGNDIIIESAAILEYLEEMYPDTHALYDKDPIKRAQMRAFCELINSFLQPMQNLRVVQRLGSEFNIDQIQWINPWFQHGFTALETMLGEQGHAGKFTYGNNISMPDVYLFPQVFSAMRRFKFDVTHYPRVNQIYTNLQQEQAFIDASPQNQPDFVQPK